MDFRLAHQVRPLQQRINIREPLMLVGSCFTDHMSARLRAMKFNVQENPNGILFNPLSIARAVDSWLDVKQYNPDDLFHHQDLWHSWDFHGRFSHPVQDTCLRQINDAVRNARYFLEKTSWLMLTLGSAFVYEAASGVVANCHKLPANTFVHRLAGLTEVNNALHQMIERLLQVNPGLKILFTISPVRHAREGLIENNRSKGVLHLSVMEMQQRFEQVAYFPAYELVIDDLRDYRFYAEDMIHPNHAATQYVWEKFRDACFDEETLSWIQEMEPLSIGMKHRPFHPDTEAHRRFLDNMYDRSVRLQQRYPFVDLGAELAYFNHRHRSVNDQAEG